MSMEDFAKPLTPEQRQALLAALTETINLNHQTYTENVSEEPQQKEVATNNVADDFTMHKKSSLQNNSRRMPVKAKENTWTDTGEFKEVSTPNTARTPRNRQPPQKKNVTCHVCGKSQKVNSSIVYGEYYRCDRCTGR